MGSSPSASSADIESFRRAELVGRRARCERFGRENAGNSGAERAFAGLRWEVWLVVEGGVGELPKRSNGSDCKSDGYAFTGSNPVLPTKKVAAATDESGC